MITISINFCQYGREVIEIEREAVGAMLQRLDHHFNHACELILKCQGRVIVIGMGKSGHIAKKLAATFASTGTPAFYIHPGEAGHGDLGMIDRRDVVLAISYSGETEEILNLLPLIRLSQIPLIAMTGHAQSTLAQAAHCKLDISVTQEACPLGLAPTASTTATLALGDAIAISLLRARGFSTHDFARYHPSGSLGKRLLMRVTDIMHQKENLPTVSPQCTIAQALVEITQKRMGMTTIINPERKLIGIFTDGDLRRTLDKGYDIHATPIQAVMTVQCTTVPPTMRAAEALNIMREKKITSLPVVDETNTPVGVVHLHDLVRAGVV